MTQIPIPLASSARARPDHPALQIGGEAITYRALADAAARWAGALAARGVGPGDRVALAGPPSAAWIAAMHGIGWLGAAAVPLSERLTPDQLAALLEALAPAETLAITPDAPMAPRADPLPERLWPLDEVRLVLFSSGSTGQPKTISLTTAQLTFSAMGSAIRLGHDPADRWLCCLPLHHVGGLSILLRCALYGTTAVVEAGFEPGLVARALDWGDATLVSLVPEMLRRVLDARPERRFPPTVRALLLGGAPCPPALLARCAALEAPVALTWGMTEVASQISTRHPGDTAYLGASGAHSGPPLAFARVVAEDGQLTVEGPIAPGGRLRTMDRGRLDLRGRVAVTGRADRVILSGGENIDPAEIEAALVAHPGIAEAVVIARPDPRWGERPVAWLVGLGEERPDDASLAAWCRGRLEGFKCPDGFRWLEAIPRTAMGKLDREALGLLERGRG